MQIDPLVAKTLSKQKWDHTGISVEGNTTSWVHTYGPRAYKCLWNSNDNNINNNNDNNNSNDDDDDE